MKEIVYRKYGRKKDRWEKVGSEHIVRYGRRRLTDKVLVAVFGGNLSVIEQVVMILITTRTTTMMMPRKHHLSLAVS